MAEIEAELETKQSYTGEDLSNDMRVLNLNPPLFAIRLRYWGDHREHKTIVRSIQRMLVGNTIVSGEMRVLINMLLHQQRFREHRSKNINWQELDNDNFTTQFDDYNITLFSKTKGRYQVSIINKKTGRDHPWPIFSYGLEAAKRSAMITLDEAIRFDLDNEAIEKINGSSNS
jgi:hypothetical protein